MKREKSSTTIMIQRFPPSGGTLFRPLRPTNKTAFEFLTDPTHCVLCDVPLRQPFTMDHPIHGCTSPSSSIPTLFAVCLSTCSPACPWIYSGNRLHSSWTGGEGLLTEQVYVTQRYVGEASSLVTYVIAQTPTRRFPVATIILPCCRK